MIQIAYLFVEQMELAVVMPDSIYKCAIREWALWCGRLSCYFRKPTSHSSALVQVLEMTNFMSADNDSGT